MLVDVCEIERNDEAASENLRHFLVVAESRRSARADEPEWFRLENVFVWVVVRDFFYHVEIQVFQVYGSEIKHSFRYAFRIRAFEYRFQIGFRSVGKQVRSFHHSGLQSFRIGVHSGWKFGFPGESGNAVRVLVEIRVRERSEKFFREDSRNDRHPVEMPGQYLALRTNSQFVSVKLEDIGNKRVGANLFRNVSGNGFSELHDFRRSRDGSFILKKGRVSGMECVQLCFH